MKTIRKFHLLQKIFLGMLGLCIFVSLSYLLMQGINELIEYYNTVKQ